MQEIEILKEISKDSKMGMDSINMVGEKVQDEKFQKLLDEQHNEYQNIFDRTQEILKQHGETIEDVPAMQKMMGWMGIQMNTMNDKSNSQLSELLIQGNDMGIIKGHKLLNGSNFTTPEIENLLSDFVRLQEKNIDDLKKWL
jgi:hypothetical protein